MSNASEQFLQYALNARATSGAQGYTGSNRADAPAVNGWNAIKVEKFRSESSDFAAQAYTDGNGNFRVSIRPSIKTWGDWANTNVALTTGKWNAELTDAIRFYGELIIQVKDAFPGLRLNDIRAKIDGSGFSQGGALIEAASKFWGTQGMNIDGPGVNSQVKLSEFFALKSEFRSRGLSELQDNYTLLPGQFEVLLHTIVGDTGTHITDAKLTISSALGSLQSDRDAAVWVGPAIDAATAGNWLNLNNTLQWHDLNRIMVAEGYPNPEAAAANQRLAVMTVTSPADSPTRNSANYITDTSANDHLVVIKAGGTVWDAYVTQKNSASGFKDWNEYKAATAASNPGIADLNQIPAGTKLYQAEKLADGSITYNYASGVTINNNPVTGEYAMTVPNSGPEGGFTTTRRIADTNMLGGEGYTVRQTSTNKAGDVTFEFTGRQASLDAPITPQSSITTTDSNADGKADDIELKLFNPDGTPQGNTIDLLDPTTTGTQGVGSDDFFTTTVDKLRSTLGAQDNALLAAAELRTLRKAQGQDEAWGGGRVLELSDSELGDYYRYGQAHPDVDTPLLLDAGSGLGVLPSVNLGSGSMAVDVDWMIGSGDTQSVDSFVWNLGGSSYNYGWSWVQSGYTTMVDDGYSQDWDYSYGSSDWYNAAEVSSDYYWDQSDSYTYFYPVALDLDGDGIELIAQENSHAYYDVTGDGYRHDMGWLSPDDAFLSIDENADGKISTARELSFAQWTTSTTDTDMDALRTDFDTNHNGKIDSGDALYSKLRIWQDKNSDGVSDTGEVKTLAEAGILSVSLAVAKTDWVSGGNRVAGFSSYNKTNGSLGWAADIGLDADASGWKRSDTSGFVKLTNSGGLTYGFGQSAALNLNMGVSQLDGVVGTALADVLTAGSRQAVMMEGGAGNDKLTGGSADDWLVGGGGTDILDGGAGDDVLLIDQADIDNSKTNIIGGSGFDIAVFTGNEDISFYFGIYAAATGIEAVVGGGGNDTIRYSGIFDDPVFLFGNAGDDDLTGYYGGDVISGGIGNDKLYGRMGDDIYLFNRGDGVDEIWDESHKVEKSPFFWDYVDAGNDTVRFGQGINPEDVLYDRVDGSNDLTLVITKDGVKTGDRVILKDWDLIKKGWTNPYKRVENIQFSDGQKFSLINLFSIPVSNDGGVVGNSSNNLLNGGPGKDSMVGDAGDDTYIVDNKDDLVFELPGGGQDTVIASVNYALIDQSTDETVQGSEVEILRLIGKENINGTGNSGNNTIRGNVGNNVIIGKIGNDTLSGEAGNDTYRFDAGDGNDRIESSAGYDRLIFGAGITPGQIRETLHNPSN